MKIETEIHRPRPNPPLPPSEIEIRLRFSIEEARRFFDMMEEHERHSGQYGGDLLKKKMARDIGDRTHNALEEAKK